MITMASARCILAYPVWLRIGGGSGSPPRRRSIASRSEASADVPVVEQRQAAVAQAKSGERPRHPRNSLVQPRVRVLGLGEQRPDVHEVAQHLQMVGWRTLVVAPIGQNLNLESLSKGLRRPKSVPFVTGEALTGRDQGLQVLDQVIAAHVPFHHSGEVACLSVQ